MWKELLQKLESNLAFSDPVAEYQIADAVSQLKTAFPDELVSLLKESNGIVGEYGPEIVWSLDRIIADNTLFRNYESFRDIYMPFHNLLFFGDNGSGDQFAFPIHADGVIHRPDVFAWNHEDDSRSWVAPSLRVFCEWWKNGNLTF